MPVHPQSLAILQEIAVGDRVIIDEVHYELTKQLIEQRLSLPADGVVSGFAQVTIAEMEQEFGAKVSGKYKLSGCNNTHQHDCYRWFLEAVWVQSKTYTLSVRAKSILKTTEITVVKWARILKDRMRLEAQRVIGQMNRAATVGRVTLIMNCKMGQILRLLFSSQQSGETPVSSSPSGVTPTVPSLLQRRRPQSPSTAGASSSAVPYLQVDPPAVTESITTSLPTETFTTPRPIRPVVTHALAAIDRWRQQVQQQREGVQTTSVSRVPVTTVSATVLEMVTPLSAQNTTDAVVVTTCILPWDDPQ